MRKTFVRAAILVAAAVLVVTPVPAASAAGRGQDIAFEDVVARLRSSNVRARIDALELLKAAGYLDAVMPVAALLKDPAPEVQAKAIETEVALYLADENYTRAIGRDIVKSNDASLALLAFAQGPGATIASVAPPGLITALIGALESSDQRVRFDATYAIGVLGEPLVVRGQFPDPRTTVPRLRAGLKETNPTLRAAAAQVLGRLFDAALRYEKINADILGQRGDAGDDLVSTMNDADELVRSSSISAVGRLRHERAIRALVDFCAYYKRDRLGLVSLDALARIAHPSSLAQFATAFEINDEEVRRIALEGTARIGDKSALSALIARAVSDKSPVVRQAVAFARARTGDFAELSLIADGFRDADLQANAFNYLVELGPGVAPSLAGAASYKDARVRAGLAEVLGIIGSTTTLPVLEALGHDRDRLVSAAALRSQKRLATRPPGAPRQQ